MRPCLLLSLETLTREASGREGSGQSVMDGAVKRSMATWVLRVVGCLFPEKATGNEMKMNEDAGLDGWRVGWRVGLITYLSLDATVGKDGLGQK